MCENGTSQQAAQLHVSLMMMVKVMMMIMIMMMWRITASCITEQLAITGNNILIYTWLFSRLTSGLLLAPYYYKYGMIKLAWFAVKHYTVKEQMQMNF